MIYETKNILESLGELNKTLGSHEYHDSEDCTKDQILYFVALTNNYFTYKSVVFKSLELATQVYNNAEDINWNLIFNPLINKIKHIGVMEVSKITPDICEDAFFDELLTKLKNTPIEIVENTPIESVENTPIESVEPRDLTYLDRIKRITVILEQPKTITETKELLRDINNGESDCIWAEDIDSILLELNKEIEESEVNELFTQLDDEEEDFTIELEGEEYRFIHKDSIDEIYKETIKDIVTDCYDLNLDEIPSFISFNIDWDKTAENCMVDGYGHTFSSYDSSEVEVGNYYIFRTN